MLAVRSWAAALAALLLCIDFVSAILADRATPLADGTTVIADGYQDSLQLQISFHDGDLSKKGKPFYQLISYGSILEFDDDTTKLFNDDQLFGLALQAYQEMRKLHVAVNSKCEGSQAKVEMPTVISAMALGNKVYISSGLKAVKPKKGEPNRVDTAIYVDYPDPYLRTHLNRCRQAMLETAQDDNDQTPVVDRHRSQGACAEIMTMLTYYEHNHKLPHDLPSEQQTGRIAAWGSFMAKENELGGYYAAACNDRRRDRQGNTETGLYGCAHFLDYEKVTEPVETGEKYTRDVRGSKDLLSSRDSWPTPSSSDARAKNFFMEAVVIKPKSAQEQQVPGS